MLGKLARTVFGSAKDPGFGHAQHVFASRHGDAPLQSYFSHKCES